MWCVCAHVDVLCSQSSHCVLQRGFPTSIHGVLVSSAPDNTPSSIIMRCHTPLGTQADKVFFSPFLPSLVIPLQTHSFSLCLSSKGIIFKPPFSGTGQIASTLNQLHSTSTSSKSVPSISTHTATLSPYYNIAQDKPLNNAWARYADM